MARLWLAQGLRFCRWCDLRYRNVSKFTPPTGVAAIILWVLEISFNKT
jgi:hypothetical protein